MPLLQLPNLSNVVAGNTATLEIPVGSTYNKITFNVAGVTNAQVSNIRVQVNGKTIQEYDDLDQLDAINAFYSRPQSGAYHTMWFERMELSEGWRRITGLGTLDVQTFTILMDIDAAAAAPIITAMADKSVGTPLGLIMKLKKFPVTFAASGEQDIDKIPRIGKITAMHFGKADVNNVVIKRDDVELIDASKNDLAQENAFYGRVAQNNYTHVDFIRKGELAEAMEVIEYADGRRVQDLRARLDLGSAGQVNMLIEYVDSFSGA
ncbi:MAG: major capsid protein P2 [Methylococcales bacterium]